MTRRLPRAAELAPLLRRARRTGTSAERRVAGAADVADLRRLARRRAPRSVFDYVDGAAGDEVSAARAVDAFRRVEFAPRVLRDVGTVDTSTTILGRPAAVPFVYAPTGFTRMMHTDGEAAVARVAARGGAVYALSCMGTTAPDVLAAASGDARRWFQLYVWRDRGRSRALIERAAAAGFEALVLTVDVPVGGARLRDVRNGLTIPPALTWRTFLDGAAHPAWLLDLLTTEPLSFAVLDPGASVPMAELAAATFDPTVTLADMAWFREVWPGPIVVKGVHRVDDAETIAAAGVDAIVVSNHGGRQLDRAVTPLDALGPIVDRVGDRVEVFVDGGVRSGADVAAAIGLGARAVLVGRAYLYGLMAGGEAGVQRVHDLLLADLRRSMQLLGVTAAADLDGSVVRLRA